MSIRENLYKWRDNEALKKGIENFRVLPNSTLDEIANTLPKNKVELCNIRGIKEMKFAQYGNQLLSIINGDEIEVEDKIAINKNTPNEESFLSVGEYLNLVNSKLNSLKAKIKGEVVSFQISGNAIYFSIKDSLSDSSLSVFMWMSDYRMSGIEIEVGIEVLVYGHSEIYKPTGKFSLRAQTIELVGEGALKKAYDELKNKFQKEGLFDKDKKRTFTDFPTKIGVITSKQGAVIHDFLNNLGKFGYSIKFIDSRVEGVLAIKELLTSIKRMDKIDIDVLVIIRGGGSLESLQAFNNEHVVRAISNFKVPVMCAIGHDKDVPLAQMVSDYAPSTPSICTSILNESWNNAKYNVELYKKEIISKFEYEIYNNRNIINKVHNDLSDSFQVIQRTINSAINSIYASRSLLERAINERKTNIIYIKNNILDLFTQFRQNAIKDIEQVNAILDAYNPMRQLKIGYSILYLKNSILRSVEKINIGDEISANLSDGDIKAKIIKINKNG